MSGTFSNKSNDTGVLDLKIYHFGLLLDVPDDQTIEPFPLKSTLDIITHFFDYLIKNFPDRPKRHRFNRFSTRRPSGFLLQKWRSKF